MADSTNASGWGLAPGCYLLLVRPDGTVTMTGVSLGPAPVPAPATQAAALAPPAAITAEQLGAALDGLPTAQQAERGPWLNNGVLCLS